MMIITFHGLMKYFYYLNWSRCSSEQISTQKIQKESTELLSFSFDKESFQDLQCNFNNQILSHSSLKQTPFYYSKPVKNLLSTFCLFFQYSQMKNNEDFRFLVENLFKNYQGHINFLSNGHFEFNFDPTTFIYQLDNFRNELDRMIAENGKGIVLIEEKDGFIFITQDNNSSSDFSPHFLSNFLNLKFDTSGNQEIKNAMIKFYTKLEEMHLSGSLKVGFDKLLNRIYDSECKNVRDKLEPQHRNLEESNSELENTFKKFCYLLSMDVKTSNEEFLNFGKKYNEYRDLYTKMHLYGELPVYLNDIQYVKKKTQSS